MTARRSFQPLIVLSRPCASVRSVKRVETILLLITIILMLFVLGICLRNAMIGGVPPVMATITVKQGDTLWSLAEQYGDPNLYILERVHAFSKANGLKEGQAIREGQTLVIPVTNTSAKAYYGGKYARGETSDQVR